MIKMKVLEKEGQTVRMQNINLYICKKVITYIRADFGFSSFCNGKTRRKGVFLGF